MAQENPFKKASRGKKWVKLLLSGDSGSGKTLTAIQLACHMALALGRPGSVALIDTEDGSADLYSFDSIIKAPYLCACEQCMKPGAERMVLEFDHIDLRDHSPDEIRKKMAMMIQFDYAVGVIDSASHEWCGRNGCLAQVDALKGDGKGRATDNAWKVVTEKHDAFLADIRAIPIHLIATVRVKPSREKGEPDVIVQRDKDGPFYYEFGFWGRVNRGSAGTIHLAKSRSGHFQGEVWSKAGKYAAEQFMLWAGRISLQPPIPEERDLSPKEEARPDPTKGTASNQSAIESGGSEKKQGDTSSRQDQSQSSTTAAPPKTQTQASTTSREKPNDIHARAIALGKSKKAKALGDKFLDEFRGYYRAANGNDEEMEKVIAWAAGMIVLSDRRARMLSARQSAAKLDNDLGGSGPAVDHLRAAVQQSNDDKDPDALELAIAEAIAMAGEEATGAKTEEKSEEEEDPFAVDPNDPGAYSEDSAADDPFAEQPGDADQDPSGEEAQDPFADDEDPFADDTDPDLAPPA